MKASEGLRNLILRFRRASMESVRVRLEFKRRGVLAESQLTEGLRRTWLLLKPEIECISDLAAYLLHTFNLQESCPNGLVLSVCNSFFPNYRRKKNKVVTTHKCLVVTEDDQNDVHVKENGGLHHRRVLPKKSVRKHKSSKLSESSALESDEISNDTTKSTPHAKRFCQLQDNGEESVDVSHKPGETKKIPSRSARRKKAKRRWLREQVKAEKEKLLQGHTLKKDDEQSPVKGNQKVVEEHQQPDENSDEEDDIVPVVIKPGHIRFERLGKVDADRAIQQNQIPTENLQWHGITSKKKGQKWGIEKVASYKRNEWTSLNQESSEMLATEIETIANNPMDFDKLTPYTSVPKKGDVVAYRLIELSSSWTPELSAFRVGKISHYDPVSNRIKLVPPIGRKGGLIFAWRHGLDVKINYSSLLHIRIVKHGNLDSSAKPVTGRVNEVPVDNGTALSGFSISNNNKETPAPARENGEVNAWDEISEALNAKKSQLTREDGWSKEESSGKREWSYRAMRGSALGPTMALLRAQNEL
ncbi:hypothetical protein FH972_009235 [Carpinus fangiana]|uniref:Coilin tudor domain-containing protein n=1 Tax=Carpinus fangiana TaxID=176857 RepID=A0A5N6R413_9ROSI|nr:hypothetical protein FH972_009235 [Carpinus fangiana]